MVRVVSLMLSCWLLVAAEPGNVAVSAAIQNDEVVVTFTPQGFGLHLYGLELTGPIGQATRVVIPDGQWFAAAGPTRADQPTTLSATAGVPGLLPVFPDGPVVVRVPITRSGPEGPARVLVSYMACTKTTCMLPVTDREIVIGALASTAPEPVASEPPVGGPAQALADLLATTVPEPHAGPAGLDWFMIADTGELRAVLDQARADGQSAFLDFTGVSCKNCQLNARTVFPRPDVRAALAGLALVEIDTDRYGDLGVWQAEVFGTSARPLYARVASDGAVTVWTAPLAGPTAAGDAETRFVAVLEGGAGDALDLAALSWPALILVAVLGGLFTLVMPCTYPMIPLTVNFFVKQAEDGRGVGRLALAYGAGIVVLFAGLGLITGLVFDTDVTAIAGSPWTHLVVAVAMSLLGLGLLGVLQLVIPSKVQTAAATIGGTGYVGALLLGLTFVVTAFTCTAPVAGGLLIGALQGGDWTRALFGMTVYGLVLALPFVLLGFSPTWLRRLPQAGAWMEEFKVVGGLIEIASALAFLTVCDVRWEWGLLSREVVFGAWALVALAIAAYLGRGMRQGLGALRLAWFGLFLGLAGWLIYGLSGGHLGPIEAWLAS